MSHRHGAQNKWAFVFLPETLVPSYPLTEIYIQRSRSPNESQGQGHLMKEGLGVENKRLIESPSSFPISLPLNTIGPPYSRVPHSQVQPTIDRSI